MRILFNKNQIGKSIFIVHISIFDDYKHRMEDHKHAIRLPTNLQLSTTNGMWMFKCSLEKKYINVATHPPNHGDLHDIKWNAWRKIIPDLLWKGDKHAFWLNTTFQFSNTNLSLNWLQTYNWVLQMGMFTEWVGNQKIKFLATHIHQDLHEIKWNT